MKYVTNATEPYLEPAEPSLQPMIVRLQISCNSLIASTIVCFEAVLVFCLHRSLLSACYIPRPFQILLYFMTLWENLVKSYKTGYVP